MPEIPAALLAEMVRQADVLQPEADALAAALSPEDVPLLRDYTVHSAARAVAMIRALDTRSEAVRG